MRGMLPTSRKACCFGLDPIFRTTDEGGGGGASDLERKDLAGTDDEEEEDEEMERDGGNEGGLARGTRGKVEGEWSSDGGGRNKGDGEGISGVSLRRRPVVASAVDEGALENVDLRTLRSGKSRVVVSADKGGRKCKSRKESRVDSDDGRMKLEGKCDSVMMGKRLGGKCDGVSCDKCFLVLDKDATPTRKGTQRVYSFAEAPSYLKFNPYITSGYRSNISPWECVKSLFWWTNETLNIWSHLLGWIFFLGLSIYDSQGLLNLPTTHTSDRVIITLLLISFQACMLLSALYHVFCCCSEKFYRRWLSADLFGVSLSLLAIYISGIYFAFSCVPFWLHFYLITVAVIFVSAMVLQILPVVKKPSTTEAFRGRLIVFGGWAAYGVVPVCHWALLHGGMSSPVVALLLPRIFWMYGISVAAFFFFVFRIPEKLYPGLVNFIGSSHQIWHILIVAALYHWHNTGLLYLQFRAHNSCKDEYAFLFPSSVAHHDHVLLAK